MPAILWIIIAVVTLYIAYDVFWFVLEWIRPFEYRNVPFAELREHVNQIYRRGLQESQMVIRDEATNASMRVMKTIDCRHRSVKLRVIVDDVTRYRAGGKELRSKYHVVLGFPIAFVIRGCLLLSAIRILTKWSWLPKMFFLIFIICRSR